MADIFESWDYAIEKFKFDPAFSKVGKVSRYINIKDPNLSISLVLDKGFQSEETEGSDTYSEIHASIIISYNGKEIMKEQIQDEYVDWKFVRSNILQDEAAYMLDKIKDYSYGDFLAILATNTINEMREIGYSDESISKTTYEALIEGDVKKAIFELADPSPREKNPLVVELVKSTAKTKGRGR